MMTDNQQAAVEIKQISKQFTTGRQQVQALDNVSLSLSQGSIVSLVGPDGAGKTTLLRLAAGLLLPDSGSIRIFGLDPFQQAEQVHSVIGYMPQRFGLYEDLSIAENLDLYARLHNVNPAEKQQRFSQLMAMTGLAPFTTRLAGRLSGGMKQKLGLACTLLSQPRLLLLDEPSVGVDPVSRRELWNIIEQQIKDNGMTVLLSTAYMDEAERCQHVVMMNDGKILAQNSPDYFKQQMQGHCFHISHPDISNRKLQEMLAGQPGIVDAVIQGDKVRIVCQHAQPPRIDRLIKTSEKIKRVKASPRLEDAFISLLKKQQSSSENDSPASFIKHRQVKESDEEVIRVVNADRWFGQFQAVKNLNFSVRRGEIFGLLGANGAGKTTTFRMLCGLLPATHGQLTVVGMDLRTAAAKARARIGYMSQKFSLYSHLTVNQNLDFFSHVYGLRNTHRLQQKQWALKQFELTPFQDFNSSDLPLGYKQRLAMACALMHEPDVLFLDEPTSGVDPLARREFWNRTNQLAASGVTVLVTTHFMEEAEYCDRLVIMVEGEILTSGTPHDIKQQVVSEALPEPTMEEAFIQLVEAKA